jgi:hypothetical protein
MEGGAVGHNYEMGHPRTIPARFGLFWFSIFRGKDLNVILHQNMPNFHNRYKSAKRKFHRKAQNIYMLN